METKGHFPLQPFQPENSILANFIPICGSNYDAIAHLESAVNSKAKFFFLQRKCRSHFSIILFCSEHSLHKTGIGVKKVS